MDTGCRGHPCRPARSGPNDLVTSAVCASSWGCGESFAAVAAQYRVETLAEIKAARFVIGDRGAAHVAAANRPYPADHRMTSLAIAEEIIRELAKYAAPRFGVESAPRGYGEDCVQEPRDRIEAQVCVAIRAEPALFVELVMLESDVLRVELVEIPIDNRAFLGEPRLVFGAGQRRHDEKRHDIEADLFECRGCDPPAVGAVDRKRTR